MLQKLLRIQDGFRSEREVKGVTDPWGGKRGSRLSFVVVTITKQQFFFFNLQTRKKKIKIRYKIVVYFNKMLNIT